MSHAGYRRNPAWLAVAVSTLAAGLVVYFDLQSSLPLLDEYARRWSIGRLASGKGVALWGTSPNLVQALTALPLALARLDPMFWRLAVIPFLAATGVFTWLIACRLGAGTRSAR